MDNLDVNQNKGDLSSCNNWTVQGLRVGLGLPWSELVSNCLNSWLVAR